MDTSNSNCLIVVAVHDGRHFNYTQQQENGNNSRDHLVAYLEARFNGEVLVSDVVELDSDQPGKRFIIMA